MPIPCTQVAGLDLPHHPAKGGNQPASTEGDLPVEEVPHTKIVTKIVLYVKQTSTTAFSVGPDLTRPLSHVEWFLD
eukprot:CAMPEP_0185756176 /NCGR_PEP_ID=MMETSP1174-20130828/14613_1 /TAXON_ID=35687 /ORGANISM="Dictyocha speculum, Strain CCMP1381" /LENGTH=75 /DNA_ID=CAMNT_0028435033 /DNA_START=371 /DNA_END=598 /DNA_ORIENTATION=-